MKTIPQIDLKAIYKDNQAEIDLAIKSVLESGCYILGRQVEMFENKFSQWTKIPHAISVANGTDAIELSLRVSGVQYGDLVATVSNTAVATIAAIERAGAVPVFIEIDEKTMTLCPNHLASLLEKFNKEKKSIKAVVPVHLYGHMADMPAIMELSSKYGFTVIEDCAQAHGAILNNKMAGTYGHLAAFSFYPTKNLGGFGDAGAIATKDQTIAENLRYLKQYGWRERNNSLMSGINSRMDEMQAAILSVLIEKLDKYNAKRQEIASAYTVSHHSDIIHPFIAPDAQHVFHQYVIRTKQRKNLQHYLAENQINTSIHYPIPVHLQDGYRGKYPLYQSLAMTEQYATEVLSLPMNPFLTGSEVDWISSTLMAWNSNQ